jgi:hypothetical protein
LSKLVISNSRASAILKEIDEEGTNLTRTQIDFVASLIDSKVEEFTITEKRRLLKIFKSRVKNQQPELD